MENALNRDKTFRKKNKYKELRIRRATTKASGAPGQWGKAFKIGREFYSQPNY